MRTVLIVCHANTARSIMAHALLERMLEAREASHRFRIRSGGIANYARDGMLPSLDARLVLREDGIELAEDTLTSTDLRRHRHLVAEADLILTMTEAQKETIRLYPEARDRVVFTLREFAGEAGDIGDPAMQGEDVFRACRDEIKRCLVGSIDRLLAAFPEALPRCDSLAPGAETDREAAQRVEPARSPDWPTARATAES